MRECMREEEAYTMMNVRKDRAQMSIVYNTLEQKRKCLQREKERVRESVCETNRESKLQCARPESARERESGIISKKE